MKNTCIRFVTPAMSVMVVLLASSCGEQVEVSTAADTVSNTVVEEAIEQPVEVRDVTVQGSAIEVSAVGTPETSTNPSTNPSTMSGPYISVDADGSVMNSPAADTVVVPPVVVKPVDIDPLQARERLSEVVVLDVRTPAEFAQGHIDGAINVDVLSSEFETTIAQLDPEKTYLVHCAVNTKNGRAEQAMDTMLDMGFNKLENLVGGYNAWAGTM